MKLYAHRIIFVLLLVLPFSLSSQIGDPIKQKELLASKYMQSGEFEKAGILYAEIFNKNPSILNYQNYLNCLIELKDFSKAEKVIRTMKKKQRNLINENVEYGYLYELAGQAKKSDKKYQQSINALKPGVQNTYQLSNAFMRRQKMDFAVEVYKKGREINKNKELFAFQLVGLYFSSGRYDELSDEYMNLLEYSPKYDQQIRQQLKFQLSDDLEHNFNSILKSKLIERSRKRSSELQYSELLYWYSLQMKEFDMALIQAKALDLRLKEDGEMVFELGRICLSNNIYSTSIEAFEYIVKKKGIESYLYDESRIYLLEAQYQQLKNNLSIETIEIQKMKTAFEELLKELGKNNNTIDLIINLAHIQAFYLSEVDNAQYLLEEALKIQNIKGLKKANVKLELADILLLKNEEWESVLLYSQVEKEFKGQAIAYDAKYKLAKLYFYLGEFDWSLVQLNVLKSSTTKFIANDALELSLIIKDNIAYDSSYIPLQQFAEADLHYYKKEYELALEKLNITYNLYTSHPIADDILYKKGLIFMTMQDYPNAVKMLSSVSEEYSQDIFADNAIFQLGWIYENKLNDPEKAKAYYKELILNYPGSIYTNNAAKLYRRLRGDSKKDDFINKAKEDFLKYNKVN